MRSEIPGRLDGTGVGVKETEWSTRLFLNLDMARFSIAFQFRNKGARFGSEQTALRLLDIHVNVKYKTVVMKVKAAAAAIPHIS